MLYFRFTIHSMKQLRKIIAFFSLAVIAALFTMCEKDEPVNIVLWDKPLNVIQHYAIGKWKHHYSEGGIAGIKIVNKNNSYMIIKTDHFLKGSDLGIYTDTSAVWVKANNLIGKIYPYLLKYPKRNSDLYESLLFIEIKDDTLATSDNWTDGFIRYYTKIK